MPTREKVLDALRDRAPFLSYTDASLTIPTPVVHGPVGDKNEDRVSTVYNQIPPTGQDRVMQYVQTTYYCCMLSITFLVGTARYARL